MIELGTMQVESFSGVMIPLDQIRESATNPWHGRSDITELTESVRKHGVLSDVLIRYLPEGGYELVSGHRRSRAAKAAGLTEIPAKVRALTDAEALELSLIENIQRKDIHEIDEGDQYRRLVQDHGYTVERIAEKVGKSRSWVYDRMRLADLDEEVRQAAYEERISVSVASLLAALPKSRQKTALEVVGGTKTREGMTVKDARSYIDRAATALLDEAGWPMDIRLKDSEGKIPVCDGCMYRAPVPGEDGNGRCLDTDCFRRKASAWTGVQILDAVRAGATRLSDEEAQAIKPHSWTRDLEDDWIDPFDNQWFLDGWSVPEDDERTVAEILGDALNRILHVGLLRDGAILRVARDKDLAEALRAAGYEYTEDEADEFEGVDDEGDEDQPTVASDNPRVARAMRVDNVRKALPALMAHVSDCPRDRPFWLGFTEMMVAWLVSVNEDDALCMMEDLGWLGDARAAAVPSYEEIGQHLSKMGEGALAALCFRLIAEDVICSSTAIETVERVAVRFGLDVEQLAAQAERGTDEEDEVADDSVSAVA